MASLEDINISKCLPLNAISILVRAVREQVKSIKQCGVCKVFFHAQDTATALPKMD